jgi:integrase/recombinase XerD
VRDPSRVRVAGPLEPYVEGFGGELVALGYRPDTAAMHLRVMSHLSGWLASQGLDATALTPMLVDVYLAERRSMGCPSHWTRRSLAPLLGFLGRQAVIPAQEEAAASPVAALLGRYARWLAAERGLAATTIRRNVELVRPFVSGWERAGRVELERLRAADVTAFVVAGCRNAVGGTAPRMVTALRSLLRFLHVEGFIEEPLAAVVPPVAARKLAGLPKALTTEQVAALLASCDQATVVGRRDLAILKVLVRLGLRAGEVAALQLDDIDWRRGELVVGGKGNRHDRLPLPADVGQAIVAYLTAGRPHAAATAATAGSGVGVREVFVRARAPRQALTRGAVTQVVARAARRAGLGVVYAHRLRHTAATGMLRAGGSLGEIGQVLRHRRALTTALYAKVDLQALRPLARRWPAGIPGGGA